MEGPASLEELAQQLAVDEVRKYFGELGHLDKLAKVREEYERKLIAVETQLEAGVQAQLDEMQNAVMLLNMAKVEMQRVQASFEAIDEQCGKCTAVISDFDHITRVCNARVNISEILQQLEIYDAVPKRVAELTERLNADKRELKPVFTEWLQLNAWRTKILSQVSDAMTEAGRKEERIKERLANWEELDPTAAETSWGQSAEAQSQILDVLGDHFRKVEELGDLIWGVVAARLADFLDLAQYEGAADLVVAVETVERIDLQDERERNRRIALGEPPEKMEMLLPPQQRRKDALAVLERTIDARLDQMLPKTLMPAAPAPAPKAARSNEHDEDDDEDEDEDEDEDDSSVDSEATPAPAPEAPPSNVAPFITAANFLIVDLSGIAEDVRKCFPEDYNVVGLYRWVLERRLLALLRPLWAADVASPGEKLQLIGWLDHYVHVVESLGHGGGGGGGGAEAEAAAEGSDSARMAADDRQSQLRAFEEDHRAAAAARTREFRRECDNMMRQYIQVALPRMRGYVQAILDRNNAPEATSDGHLRTAVPEDLFHALSQELSVVDAHGVHGKQLATFFKDGVLGALREYQHTQTRRANDASSDHPSALCCAMMNDYERMYDLCDSALFAEVRKGLDGEQGTSEALLADVQGALDSVAVGFLKGVEAGTKRIVSNIMLDLEEENVTAVLFTEAWQSGQACTAETLRLTIEDYFDHPERGLRRWLGSELLFGRTVALTMSQLIAAYVQACMRCTQPFSNTAAVVARLRRDATMLKETFSAYLDVLRFGKIRSREAFEERLAILHRIADVLGEDQPHHYFEDVAQGFGAFAQQAIARLLFLRGDLSAEEREDLLLYDVSEYANSAGAARFDLSSLPPLPQEAAAAPSGEAGSSRKKKKKRVKLKKKVKAALAAVKASKKLHREAEAEYKQQPPPTVMSMDDFLAS